MLMKSRGLIHENVGSVPVFDMSELVYSSAFDNEVSVLK